MKLKRLAIWFRNYFGFSKTETRATMMLIPLLIILLVYYGISRESMYLYPTDRKQDSILLDSLHRVFVENLVLPAHNELDSQYLPLEIFNPNQVELNWLRSRRIPHSICRNWVKYLKSGGKFRKKEDLQKIYGMNDSIFWKIEPYLLLPGSIQSTRKVLEKVKIQFDLNKADTTDLKSIRGIGSKLSARIVNFRDKLGGFVSLEQLYEVYYLDSLVVDLLKNKFNISPQFIPRKIMINEIPVENLAIHPYINRLQAKLIVAYREQHGSYQSIDELLEIPGISEIFLKRVKPYLDLNQK